MKSKSTMSLFVGFVALAQGCGEETDSPSVEFTTTTSSSHSTASNTGSSEAAIAIEVAPYALTVDEGSTASFKVNLSAKPASSVTVAVSKTNGDPDLNLVGAGALVFTPDNWNVPQSVTVAAAADSDDE